MADIFTRPGQDTPDISLTPDNQAVVLKHIRDVQFALATIAEGLKSGQPLDGSLAYNILFVSEHNLADIGKQLGVVTNGAAEFEQRNAMLRETHQRVRDLEKQLGGTTAPEAVQLSLKNMAEHLDKWWKNEGFGHISDTSFGKYGCEIELSCHLFGGYALIDSKTPLTDKEHKALWMKSLAERGFVISDEDGDKAIIDCEASRNTLLKLLRERLPSAKVQSFVNTGNRHGAIILRSVKVYLRDISEIAALPIRETEDN